MNQLVEKLAMFRGVPVLLGVGLVLLNFLIQFVAYFLIPPGTEPGFFVWILTDGNFFLHLGVALGLLGVLIGDVL